MQMTEVKRLFLYEVSLIPEATATFCCNKTLLICVQALRYANAAVALSKSDDIHLLTTLANIHRELKSYDEAEKVLPKGIPSYYSPATRLHMQP